MRPRSSWRVAWVLLLLPAKLACGGERQAEPEPAPAETLFTDEAWPLMPEGVTEEGAQWQTIRHGTLHVHLALPPEARVERSRLQYGHPVIRVQTGNTQVEITYSSGERVFEHGLSLTPPRIGQIPMDRISRMGTNTTVHYQRDDADVVSGWTRGARCVAERVAPSDVDSAFAICATLQTPRPGALVTHARDSSDWVLPGVPADATFVGGSVPMLYAGHIVAKILPRACPTMESIHSQRPGEDFSLERRSFGSRSGLLGVDYASYDGVRYQSTTSVWIERESRCCIATILEGMTSPSDEQVEYLGRLCAGPAS